MQCSREHGGCPVRGAIHLHSCATYYFLHAHHTSSFLLCHTSSFVRAVALPSCFVTPLPSFATCLSICLFHRRQRAPNVKELPMSKSFRRQRAAGAKELCNNKFRRWLGWGGGGGMWSCFVSRLHCCDIFHSCAPCLFLHAQHTSSFMLCHASAFMCAMPLPSALPSTSKSFRRQRASDVKELPTSKSCGRRRSV